jgi:kynureninase
VPVEPFESFVDRCAKAVASGGHDLVYLSHVFFDSGFVVSDLGAVVEGASPEALVVVDGYHSFMALPVDLGPLAERVFYLAGGYKYAMSGEGVCFAHCPPGYCERPVDTGWFAGFGQLETLGRDFQVEYAADGSRFLGATLQPTAIYRFNAVMDWLFGLGLTPGDIHRHARQLQDRFLDGLEGPLAEALVPDRSVADRGNFLTFRLPEAGNLYRRLLADNVVTDYRADRLRIGFGLYHDPDDVDELIARVAEVTAATAFSR